MVSRLFASTRSPWEQVARSAFYEGCCCQAPLRISLSAGTARAACYLGFGRSCPDPPSIRADHVGPVTTFRYSPVGELQQAWREAPHLKSGRVSDPAVESSSASYPDSVLSVFASFWQSLC
jgi:hypothetical protein